MSRCKHRARRPLRRRSGRVSYYQHHGGWWIYYREGDRAVRRRVADTEENAERIAAQVNAQISTASPSLFAYSPVTVSQLRDEFLSHHEDVVRSSIATVRRYRAATQHLIDFVAQVGRTPKAHEVSIPKFVAFLRSREIAPNGHPHTRKRKLRDKGVRFILEVCRSLYGYAQRMRHLPPYTANPFSDLRLDRMQNHDAKHIFVFTAATERAFLERAPKCDFAVHFALAKTGMRPGELTHLLIEDLDLPNGWLYVRNKLELGWRIKTGSERNVPLLPELIDVLRIALSDRTAGPVFLRPKFTPAGGPAAGLDRRHLAKFLEARVSASEDELNRRLSRVERLAIARGVWRDAGAIKVDAIRRSFIRVAIAAGLDDATCPKSWRHSFATLLQDANVDPLIRQQTLGHKPQSSQGALGMTGVYTHTRPETQQAEIVRALRHWPATLELARERVSSLGRECKCGPDGV